VSSEQRENLEAALRQSACRPWSSRPGRTSSSSTKRPLRWTGRTVPVGAPRRPGTCHRL